MMDDMGYGISKRRGTSSTAGVVPGIYRLAEVTDASLAISLHAPNDELRNELVPINRRYPIAELLSACRTYAGNLGEKRTVTIEYTLLDGVNDQPEHAAELAELLRDIPCKINLIPFNPFAARQRLQSRRSSSGWTMQGCRSRYVPPAVMTSMQHVGSWWEMLWTEAGVRRAIVSWPAPREFSLCSMRVGPLRAGDRWTFCGRAALRLQRAVQT